MVTKNTFHLIIIPDEDPRELHFNGDKGQSTLLFGISISL